MVVVPRLEPTISQLYRQSPRFVVEVDRNRDATIMSGDDRTNGGGSRRRQRVLLTSGQRAGMCADLSSRVDVARFQHEIAMPGPQQSEDRDGLDGLGVDESRVPRIGLSDTPPPVPEPATPSCQWDAELVTTAPQRPRQRRPHVLRLCNQFPERLGLARSSELLVQCDNPVEIEPCMSRSRLLDVTRCSEATSGELFERLEHPESGDDASGALTLQK